MKKSFTAALAITSITLSSQGAFSDSIGAPVPLSDIYQKDTLILKGRKPLALDNGKKVSFIIDANALSFREGLRLFFGNVAKTAIIFEDTGQKLCPYKNLSERKYKIERDAKRRRIYHITATSKGNAEIELIKKYGCLVTNKPDLSNIKKQQKTANLN